MILPKVRILNIKDYVSVLIILGFTLFISFNEQYIALVKYFFSSIHKRHEHFDLVLIFAVGVAKFGDEFLFFEVYANG